MPTQNNSKVAVDSRIDRSTPNVVVSSAPKEDIVNPAPEVKQQNPANLPVTLVKRLVNFCLDFLETIVVALSIFVVVYLFLVQPHEVKGSSMEPNFHDNDYILTDKISLKLHDPERGNVIIFKSPPNPDVDYIKRVIGLPGDKVKVQDGAVYINDKKLDEPYLADKTNLFPGSFLQEGVDFTVPQGEYFVMGDNRPHSSDSREFGPIKADSIIGKAMLRYWPITQFGIIPDLKYNLSSP
ncbi:MAG: signal peptidase I [Patescibacteria group bacterium]|nr:signal peptidase I [Patescibacteria group bacterium]